MTGDTRQRLLDVTCALVSRHGFAGTNVADDRRRAGFHQGRDLHHFRTREQLLVAMMDPIFHQIRDAVESAEIQRTAGAQKEALLHGYATVVAKNRSLAAVMVFDPSVHQILQEQPEWGDLIARQLTLLMQLEPGNAGVIKATAVMTGLAGAASGAPLDVDEESLVEQLCDIGRRMLGLRAPRRQKDPVQRDGAIRQIPEAPAGRWRDFLSEAQS